MRTSSASECAKIKHINLRKCQNYYKNILKKKPGASLNKNGLVQLQFFISWREQVNFQRDDDEVCFVLDQHAELDFYSASSLKQQSAGRHVAPLGHIILIPSQPVFALSP